MSVHTAFVDIGGDGIDLADITTVVVLALTIWGAVWGAVVWNGKRVANQRAQERAEQEERIAATVAKQWEAARDDLERRMHATIQEATKQIQPDANGGKSLSDVAANTNVIIERQTDVIRDVRALRERLDEHITWHLEKEEE